MPINQVDILCKQDVFEMAGWYFYIWLNRLLFRCYFYIYAQLKNNRPSEVTST